MQSKRFYDQFQRSFYVQFLRPQFYKQNMLCILLCSVYYLVATFLVGLCAPLMREYVVFPNHQGLLNLPNPTNIFQLRLAIFLDSRLAALNKTTSQLDYVEIADALVLAYHFVDPTLRLSIVMRAHMHINITDGDAFSLLCGHFNDQNRYSEHVDLTVLITPHLSENTLGWGQYSKSCIALLGTVVQGPALRTFVHEIGHAVKGLSHSVKPTFDCREFTMPEHVDLCMQIGASSVRHVMNAVFNDISYDRFELAAELLMPANIVYTERENKNEDKDDPDKFFAPIESLDSSQRFTKIVKTRETSPRGLKQLCELLVSSDLVVECTPVNNYSLPASTLVDRWRTGNGEVAQCTHRGNRTHMCLLGFAFERARLDQIVAYSAWSNWTEWYQVTTRKNTPDSNMHVFRRHAVCESFDPFGARVPNNTVRHKCTSLRKFQYLIDPNVAPTANVLAQACKRSTGNYGFHVTNRQCWQHCVVTANDDDRIFRPVPNGAACQPSKMREATTTFTAGVCFAGTCVSLVSPTVQRLDVCAPEKWSDNISSVDLIRQLQYRHLLVKSIHYFQERRWIMCDFICLRDFFARMMRQPAFMLAQVEVTFFKTNVVRRLFDKCEHMTDHFIRCVSVCLLAASENIRMISSYECAAFSIQLSLFTS